MSAKQKEKYFIDAVNFFIDFFGLHDYEIDISARETEDDACAYCEGYNLSLVDSPRRYSIFYNPRWVESAEKTEIQRSAFHEILELQIYYLRQLASNASIIIADREIDNECHRIIKRLENKIFPKIKIPAKGRK